MWKNILFIEDDEHKIYEIIQYWNERFPAINYEIKKSVRDAVVAVHSKDYDLIILDMALPNFEQTSKTSGGTSQVQGGLEVIRAITHLSKKPQIIVLTQYDGLEIEGTHIPITNSANLLRERYNCNVIGAVLYEYQNEQWKKDLDLLLNA